MQRFYASHCELRCRPERTVQRITSTSKECRLLEQSSALPAKTGGDLLIGLRFASLACAMHTRTNAKIHSPQFDDKKRGQTNSASTSLTRFFQLFMLIACCVWIKKLKKRESLNFWLRFGWSPFSPLQPPTRLLICLISPLPVSLGRPTLKAWLVLNE